MEEFGVVLGLSLSIERVRKMKVAARWQQAAVKTRRGCGWLGITNWGSRAGGERAEM